MQKQNNSKKKPSSNNKKPSSNKKKVEKKGSSKKMKISNKLRNRLICCSLAASILGGIICHSSLKKSSAVNDDLLSSFDGSLYLVDVIDEDNNVFVNDIHGNPIPYNFDDNTLAILGTKNGKTASDKMYEVMLIDNNSNLTYGLMDGKYLSNKKIDSVKVLDTDFSSYLTNTDCNMYSNASEDAKSVNLKSNQGLVISDGLFQSPYNDYLWNEAITVNGKELNHGFVISDSVSLSESNSSIYYVNVDTLNVRTNSSIDGDIISKLSRNTMISLCDDYDDFEDGDYKWVYVSFTAESGNVGKGWVAAVDYTNGYAINLISNDQATISPSDLYSECAILYDATNDKVLYEKDGYRPMRPASITKILTAYLVSKYGNLDDMLVYSSNAVNVEGHVSEQYNTTPSSPVYHVVKEGNSISVRDALNISLLLSDNATTVALAEYVESITKKDFEKLMNETASELGCTDANFTNAYGYEEPNHLVSAHDMAIIGASIAKDAKDVLEIMGSSSYSLEYDGTVINHQSPLINESIIQNNKYYSQYAIGCKTGWTEQSGQTMVSLYEKDGHVYVIVSLKGEGMSSKNEDAKLLSDYAFSLQNKKMIIRFIKEKLNKIKKVNFTFAFLVFVNNT